jgi:hypothetical protein
LPETARLVSRGGGTHRITLQLQPAALGEVRVVLTVRGGEVRVSLAAGAEARSALLHQAPELHQMLERAGALSPQIVVRELPTGSAPGPATTVAVPSDPGPGPGTGGNPQDRQAWTPTRTSTTDGGPDGPGADRRTRPIDSATPARTAGIDVTM